MKEWLSELCPELAEWQIDLITEMIQKHIEAERQTCFDVLHDLRGYSGMSGDHIVSTEDFDYALKSAEKIIKSRILFDK